MQRNNMQGNEVELADAVLYKNPVSVAFDVTDDFMHYKSGVYSKLVLFQHFIFFYQTSNGRYFTLDKFSLSPTNLNLRVGLRAILKFN